MSEAPPVRSGASLERRLPLLISGLLVAVLVLFGVAAYREVRTSAIARASDRLDSLIREIARNSAQGA
ncbi:MAG TPA: hypothetical protein VEA99_06525, partial [Gemmatimonadaceae bacterium]|nr:hypothetical protein [Gemmatimonadaceae bacterium]